jgi:hypothetical protein
MNWVRTDLKVVSPAPVAKAVCTESNSISSNIPAATRPGTSRAVLPPRCETDGSLCIWQSNITLPVHALIEK